MQNTRIWGTALIGKILDAYRAADADEPHWVSIVFDMTQPDGVLRYGDSFGGEIPEELAAASRWWLNQHTTAKLELAKLPIAPQEDGFSCGILVDNAQQHFVDPSVPLLETAKFMDARLEVFNKICTRALEQLEIERALAIAQDEDSDDRSDQHTATSGAANDSDSDSDSPILLRRTARNAKFTFTSPISDSSPSPVPISPARVTGAKRPKGHPDAPTPNPSPQKHRIFKRQADETVPAPLQPLFSPHISTSAQSTSGDVFGPVTCHREQDGYKTDSEEGSGSEWNGCGPLEKDEYSWGPEDDAPVPPESQMSTASDDFTMDSDVGLIPDDLPSLQPISDSEDDSCDEDGGNSDTESMSDCEGIDEVHSPRARVPRAMAQPVSPPIQASKRAAAGKDKITGYWKVETAEEKTVRLEKDAREYSERAEEVRQREVEEKRKQRARDRERANERMRRHRERLREEKIADGWIPGKKRKRVDLADHDEISTADPELPEHSRPRRQFKEDDRKNNKPCGRKPKPKNKKRDARYTNWFHPILFSQVQAAASRVSKPWKPRAILKELHRANLKDFSRLTEQVIGRWIDGDSRDRGTSKWKDSVIQNVARGKGNSPGGHTTRCGVLHPYPATRKKSMITSRPFAGLGSS
ncbi:hypothetical protein B0H13DRAFT_2557989 [Mycena leptocephala]|nr:hypothetical protein B0H13DRAFT_2557989 [Mycena leptocephala]